MPSVIDADFHVDAPPLKALFPFLEEHWIEHFTKTLEKGPVQQYYPRHSPIADRRAVATEKAPRQRPMTPRLDQLHDPGRGP